MNDYIIYTDSGCDISLEQLSEWGVPCDSLTYTFNGDPKEYSNYELPIEEFYGRMKKGEVAKTSAVNSETFKEGFEKYLKQGLDILYIGFDSGISTTSNHAILAAGELREKYPDRKLIAIDTLCAAVGQGLLVKIAVDNKKAGMGIEENADAIKELMPKISHWFTVDDLIYLRRGGRVSKASQIVGDFLDIKPVLHVDDEGKLIAMSKVRGRKKALKAIVNKYAELALDPANGPLAIGHGDCKEDLEYIISEFEKTCGVKPVLVSNVYAVIGAHTGPSIIVCCFPAKQR